MPFTIAGEMQFEDTTVNVRDLEMGEWFVFARAPRSRRVQFVGANWNYIFVEDTQGNVVPLSVKHDENVRAHRAVRPRKPSDRWEEYEDEGWWYHPTLDAVVALSEDGNNWEACWEEEGGTPVDMKVRNYPTMDAAMIAAEDAYVAQCRAQLAEALEITGGGEQ